MKASMGPGGAGPRGGGPRAPATLALGFALVVAGCADSGPGPAAPAGAGAPSPRANDLSPRGSERAPRTRGIALGMHDWGGCHYAASLAEIAETGARAVELVIPYYQRDVQASSMGPRPQRTPTETCLEETIRTAHGLGLDVWLLPVVLLESAGKREWRGRLRPEDPDAWWRHYRELVLSIATLAARLDVEAMAVGSELVWSEAKAARWHAILGAVREVFGGTLLYSANWDHYEPVTFWDAVDAIGISGYFELTKDPRASARELRESWIAVRDRILPWVRATGKPLVFTEIGYPAVEGGAVHPWNYTLAAERDEDEQDRALAAFFATWHGVPELAAAFVYEWGIPGGVDEAYSPRGRLAEARVRRWMEEGRGKSEETR